MEKKGYKAFYKGLVNRYGKEFEIGKIEVLDNDPKFGINGFGFHFCKRLEDTLRYFPALEEEIEIAEVTALGLIKEAEDEYNGYYDMYSTNIIRVDRVLPREEILAMFLNMEPNERVERFIKGYKLTEEEIELFREKMVQNREVPIIMYKAGGTMETEYHFPRIIREIDQAISYYQENNKEAYQKPKQKLK